jgi:hydroxyacylglutathione hydrolase
VWPGHLGGSLCGGPAMDMKISSTLAYERAHNPMLRVEDEDEFVDRSVGSLGPQPPNFEAIVELNRGELVTQGVEVMPLTPRQVEQKRSEDVLLVDVRTDLQFDDAHIPGAVAIPAVQAGFGTRLAWLADRDQEIVLIGRDDEDARRAAGLALAVGIRRLGGFLHGGMTEWRREARPVERIERLELDDLPERAKAEPGLQILDVRERSERDSGYVPGSLFEPWHDIHALPEELDPERPVAVMCASGQRAGVAASLLQRHGARHVFHVVKGGVPRWQRLGYPIEVPGKAAA